MIDYRRTSVNLPVSLLRDAQVYAVKQNTSLTQLIDEGLSQRISRVNSHKKKSLLNLAGTLNLGGKEPPSRQQLYEDYLDEKMGD